MPEIKPFLGWRYDRKKVKDLSKVYAPPYDIISKKLQNKLYEKSPYNVVRLELGKAHSADGAGRNVYTRAKETLAEWKQKGVLRREEAPALYIYVQDYREEGRMKKRVGFLTAMRIDERQVMKHENTLAAPKKDRLALLKSVRMNLSPIFGLYEDRSGKTKTLLKKASSGRPEVDVTLDGVRHRIYVEKRPQILSGICSALRSKPMLIADGHHRFETACRYHSLRRKADHVLTYFSDCVHNPMKIYPTHRLVRGDVTTAVESLKGRGKLRSVKNLDALLKALSKTRLEDKPGYRFGFFSKKTGFLVFELDAKHTPRAVTPVERLDVSVLHKAIIEPVFGIRHIERSESIDFTRDPEEAVRRVKGGEFEAALYIRPTSLEEMLEASKKGLKMPQKSTYFYPKLLTGLVFHSVE